MMLKKKKEIDNQNYRISYGPEKESVGAPG